MNLDRKKVQRSEEPVIVAQLPCRPLISDLCPLVVASKMTDAN
jgi:hypothetical protein